MNRPGCRTALLTSLPLLASMLFTAVTLAPELRPIPSLNDDAFHFLLVQGAQETLARGGNVLDFWSPVLELGFPQFLYYQHLPHLFVVLLDRLLFGQVALITVFNAVRYVLLVGFPLTVYWSLRRLDFPREGASIAAAVAPLLSGNFNYGFEYDSYIWLGLGMYTQLWAMHLSFVALATLGRHLEEGRGRVVAVVALSALILSHLVYAYMMAISAVVLLAWGLRRGTAWQRLRRFSVVWGASALVTSYFWLPFLASKVYLSASPYLQRWKYDSFGASTILSRLVTGELFDHARLPVITALALAGAAAALSRRSRPALLALALFIVWLLLYFGRATWGPLADLLPLHEGMLMHRFIGGVDIAALMLVAAGAAWLWNLLSMRMLRWLPRWRGAPIVLAVLGCLTVLLPLWAERYSFYAANDRFLTRTQAALDADADAGAILARLASAPPGRTFAGLRTGWGRDMKLGDLAFSDLLTFQRIPAVSAPYQSLSLNADLLWDFNYRDAADYALFDVRYVVAPAAEPMPAFLHVIERRGRYALYEAPGGGYFTSGRSGAAFSGTPRDFLPAARVWHWRGLSEAGLYPQVILRGMDVAPPGMATHPLSDAARELPQSATGSPPRSAVLDETVVPQSYAAHVEVEEPATLVLKVTYHPNWQATVDGVHVPTTMVMPSYIGVALWPGLHEVTLTYRGDQRKTWLLALGTATLILAVAAGWHERRMSVCEAE